MAKRSFVTVPEELLTVAEQVADWYTSHGHTVTIEPKEIGYPYTPALRCKRDIATHLVEVQDQFPLMRINEWARYAMSMNKDTRIVLAVPHTVDRPSVVEEKLRDMGAGLLVVTDNGIMESILPKDLALNVQLPDIASLPTKLRKPLGPVYDHFRQHHWREGFEEACLVVETHARKYLKDGMTQGRIQLVSSAGKASKVKPDAVDKMPLGALADNFALIQTKTHSDQVIAKVLKKINKDRVNVAHYKRVTTAEKHLRENVGSHMWSIITALGELLGVKWPT